MKSITAFLALACLLVACKEEKRVHVEDVFNKTEEKAAGMVDQGPLQPIKPKTGTIIYKTAKSKKAREAEQKRAREEAKKDCGGDFQIIKDEFSVKAPPKGATFEYQCGE